MNIVHLGIISTGTIIVLGMAMIIPAFTQQKPERSIPSVMLSFNIMNTQGEISSWCQSLSSVLEKHDVRATVFVSGLIADSDPECVSSFSPDVDIGSQTYGYVDLTSISDYSEALEEVENGRQAIDEAGDLDSRLFRAPYGKTDENIYSLLNRPGIIADFSYVSQYNRYENNQFVRYDLKSLTGDTDGLRLFSVVSQDDDVVRPYNPVPILIRFDNSMEIDQIDRFISQLKSDYQNDIHFVNASDVVGLDLTIRKGA